MRRIIGPLILLFLIFAAIEAFHEQAAPGSAPAVTGNAQYEMRTVNTAAGPQKLVWAPNPPPPPDDSPQVARQRFTLAHFSWRKDAFDTVMMADFTFDNKNSFDIKDVTVKCVGSAPSGTAIDVNERTIFEVFHGNTKRTIPHFNMGFIRSQVKSSGCEIVDFKIIPGTKRPPAKNATR